MATLAGQRAQFTWALNQYNLAEDAEARAKFARKMAKYIAAAPDNNFTVDQVTQGQIYPASKSNNISGIRVLMMTTQELAKNRPSRRSRKPSTQGMWSEMATAVV